jgi:protein involved in polysaccharide export with SLBB domain
VRGSKSAGARAILLGACTAAAAILTIGRGVSASSATDASTPVLRTPESMPTSVSLTTGRPVDPHQYRLGSGDLLVAYVFGRISQTVPLVVGPDGTVFVPELGSTAVAGRTLADVRQELESKLRDRLSGVRVEVRLERVRTLTVYLAGEVRVPGPVFALGSSRPDDLLPDSVFTPDASHRAIEIRHLDGTRTTFDLMRFERTGVETTPIALEDGDIILVPSAQHSAGVWGGVARAGTYELVAGDSLSTLIAIAGGLRSSAMLDHALVLRVRGAGAARESIDFVPGDVVAGRSDLVLQDGDQIFISIDPEHMSLNQVTVLGLVQRTGNSPITPGTTRLADVLRSAGGFREGADLSAIRLLRSPPDDVGRSVEFERLSRLGRKDMTNSEYEAFRTQLASLRPEFRLSWDLVSSGKLEFNPCLQNGDVIVVDRITNSVRVDGQVLRPGIYPYVSGVDYWHYIELAGGFTTRGARTKVLVTHAGNLHTLPAPNVDAILPGDFVWVPEHSDITTWDHLKELLAVAASVATVYLVFRR